MVIGPAGENLVRYAAVFSGERTAGRAGVGAVMGFKNLKAVCATGKTPVPVRDRAGARKVFRRWNRLLRSHPVTGDAFPRLGTAWMLSPMNRLGILATGNHRRGRFDGADAVSGETLGRHVVQTHGCRSCPIRCGRVVKIGGRRVKGPELETLVMLGPNLENADLDLILRWNDQLGDLGMDTISTGGVMAFAMELCQRGLWDEGFEFGRVEGLSQVFSDIAHRRGVGDLLADGTRRLAGRLGGASIAVHSKGLELPAYDPRGAVGLGLGYATSNRGGCHLNAGYTVAIEGLGLNMDPRSTRSKAELTVLLQNLTEAVSSAGICLFTTYTLLPGSLVRRPESLAARAVNRALSLSGGIVRLINMLTGTRLPVHLPLLPHTRALAAVTGMRFSFGRLREAGERGFTLERLVNAGRGLTAAGDTLPRRLVEQEQDEGGYGGVPLDRMKGSYYRCRGWSGDGIPPGRLLKKLHISPRKPGLKGD